MDTGQVQRETGFSIVELMVAVAIGLIGILVIFQVFAVSEGYRRTSTSGSDAQQAGALAIYVLEHELRQAGWGFNHQSAIGCNVSAYDALRGGPLPSYTLVPVRITPAATSRGSDTIEVNYGNGGATLAPIVLSQNMANATDDYVVANRYGFQQFDLFLVAEAGQCTLAEVSCLAGAGIPGCSSDVTLNRNIEHVANGTTGRYNRPGGTTTFTVAANIFNLGQAPARNIYTVDPNTSQLVMTPFLTSNQAQPVADNIVQMKAQFGMDDGIAGLGNPIVQADDGSIDEYINSPQPTTAAQLKRLLAVRVAVVSRSANPEKPSDKTKTCDTTTTPPVWSGGAFDLSANPSWQCYRYKVFESTIPVRNMIWNQN
jgi:type IV pilus assembly protein PilW